MDCAGLGEKTETFALMWSEILSVVVWQSHYGLVGGVYLWINQKCYLESQKVHFLLFVSGLIFNFGFDYWWVW